jgi:antitoxin component YwqK of YwqJK toxin-antitoxin module
MKIVSLIITLIICKITFSQSNLVFESQLTSQNQKLIWNDNPYSGLVANFYETGQLKSIYEVKDGISNGKVTEYNFDKNFNKSSFRDTSFINQLNKEIALKKKELELLIQDTIKASKESKDYLNYEIGGYDKWLKLKEKNDEGKLNKKKKEDFDKYESLVQIKNQSIRKLVDSEKELNAISQTLKTESYKKDYVPLKLKEYSIINSSKEGLAIIYDSLGNKFGEGNYKNGKQDGEWIYYYENGNKLGKGNFTAGDEGNKGSTRIPKNGRQGYWIFYQKNGIIKEEANYKDGMLVGSRKLFFSNGKLKENGVYDNGQASGHFIFYHENGSVWTEVDYKDGKKMGLELVYNNEGKKIKESYLTNDVKNGVEKEYYDDGKLKTEGYFKMGKNHGKVKKFYESGKLEIEVEFQNGKQHGLVNTYFENGKIKYKATFDTTSIAENNLIGDFYEYNEDGTLKFHGYAYKDGKLEDKTISNSKSTNQSSVPSELKKVYKCKCCKSTINGLLEGIDKEGEEYNDFFVQLMSGQDADTFYRKLGYDGIYDYLRRDKYKFCTMKCARTCYE